MPVDKTLAFSFKNLPIVRRRLLTVLPPLISRSTVRRPHALLHRPRPLQAREQAGRRRLVSPSVHCRSTPSRAHANLQENHPPLRRRSVRVARPHRHPTHAFPLAAQGAPAVTFTSQLAFGKTQLDQDNKVFDNIWQPLEVPPKLPRSHRLINDRVQPGQKTEINKDASSDYGVVFGRPVTVAQQGALITARNLTGTVQTLSVGFMNGDNYEPTYVWKDVG